MHKTTQSTDRSTSVSLSSGSTLRSRHHYSSKKRAKDATEVLNSLVEAASASPVRESPHRSPANDDTGDRCKQTMTSASPFFSPPQQRFVLAARKESDIDWDLTTTAGSPVRRVPRAGTISDDEELVNDVKPPFLHRQGSPVLSPDITRNLPSMATAALQRLSSGFRASETEGTSGTGERSRQNSAPIHRPASSSNQPNASLERSLLSESSQAFGVSAQSYLKSTVVSGKKRRTGLEKDDPVPCDLVSDAGSHGNSVSIPAASDSYIDRNNYVTKPRWGLSTDELCTNVILETADIMKAQHNALPSMKRPCSTSAGIAISKTRSRKSPIKEKDDDLYTLDTARSSRISSGITSTFGQKMDSLSMEKVFNDPSFHGIYEQYNKNKKRGAPIITQSEPVYIGKPKQPSGPEEEPPRTDGEDLGKPISRPDKNLYSLAIREQIPVQLGILDADILGLLTDEVVKRNPLLGKLQNTCFRKRFDGTIECLSIMDLGLEKKDHAFLTASWGELAKMTENCLCVYDIIHASGCSNTKFLRNVMTFMKYAVNQGLELATLLIRTATFVVVRDGQPSDLLNYVHQVRHLTESLNNNADFIRTVREALTENFTVIPLVTMGPHEKQEISNKNEIKNNSPKQTFCV